MALAGNNICLSRFLLLYLIMYTESILADNVTSASPLIGLPLDLDDLLSRLHLSLPCLSCKGRCGNTDYVPVSLFDVKGACLCDLSCIQFGNCCPDIIQACPELGIKMTSLELVTKGLQTECYWKSMCYNEAMYLLIKSCPYSKTVCQRTNDNAKTAIPVVDLETNISYSNTLCALCNGATLLTPWEVKYYPFHIGCPYGEECVKPKVWTKNLAEGVARFHPPPALEPRQRCNGIISVNDKCSKDWPRDQVKEACENGGYSFVHFGKQTPSGIIIGKNYKNYFCAICNHENIFDLKCLFFINSLKCDDPPVYSLEKLFYVNSDYGMYNSLCEESETFIEEDNRCRKVHIFIKDEVTPYFEAGMTLHYREETDLPFDRASELISYVENEFPNLEFYIGNSIRRWEHGLDYIKVGATKSINFTKDFIDSAINISSFWAEIHKYNEHGISLLVSIIDESCEYLMYNLSEVTFDLRGITKLLDGRTRRPGQYHVINNTIYICKQNSETWIYSSTIGWITIVSMTISIICLFLNLFLRCFYPSTENVPLLILTCCLLLSHITFLLGPQLTVAYAACYTVGVILHWAFLSSFAWMSAIAFDIFIIVCRSAKLERVSTNKNTKAKLILPFLFPTFTTILSVAIDESSAPHPWRPLYGRKLCWMNSNNALLIYFVAPVGVYVFVTAFLTIATAIKLFNITQDLIQKERSQFGMIVKLSVLTGLSWTFGFIAVPVENVILFALFVILNASQGLFLLVAIWAPKIKRKIAAWHSEAGGTTKTSLKSGHATTSTHL